MSINKNSASFAHKVLPVLTAAQLQDGMHGCNQNAGQTVQGFGAFYAVTEGTPGYYCTRADSTPTWHNLNGEVGEALTITGLPGVGEGKAVQSSIGSKCVPVVTDEALLDSKEMINIAGKQLGSCVIVKTGTYDFALAIATGSAAVDDWAIQNISAEKLTPSDTGNSTTDAGAVSSVEFPLVNVVDLEDATHLVNAGDGVHNSRVVGATVVTDLSALAIWTGTVWSSVAGDITPV